VPLDYCREAGGKAAGHAGAPVVVGQPVEGAIVRDELSSSPAAGVGV
jgi:hypothetical protein